MLDNLIVYPKLISYSKHKFRKLLNGDEFRALSEYTLFSYYFINNQLRGVEDYGDSVGKLIDSIDSALNKSTFDGHIKVYRRVNLNMEHFILEREHALSGIMCDPAYVSTSLTKRIGSYPKNDYIVKENKPHYNMEIDVPSTLCGAYIAPISGYVKREYEFLIKRNVPMEVLDLEDDKEHNAMNIKARVLMK